MNKYIVRNCPAFNIGKPDRCNFYERGICHTKKDCLIKRIIDVCKATIDLISKDAPVNPYFGGRHAEASQILNMFEIEEIK